MKEIFGRDQEKKSALLQLDDLRQQMMSREGMSKRVMLSNEVDGMIGELRHKIQSEKTSSIIDALKKGYTPEEIEKMAKRSGEGHPKLEIYEMQDLK